MFGMGMSEILIICAVALLIFGPQQLPEMAKKIAKGLKEVRKASDDLKRSINLDDDDDRPRWKPPVERPALIDPPQTQTPATLLSKTSAASVSSAAMSSTSSLEAPPSIPGSALATEPDPIITAASSSVAVGTPFSEETTDPQKPSLKEAG